MRKAHVENRIFTDKTKKIYAEELGIIMWRMVQTCSLVHHSNAHESAFRNRPPAAVLNVHTHPVEK